MCATNSDDLRAALADRIAAADSLLLVTHDRPDGDGLGSMVALALAGRQAGKRVRIVAESPVPRVYAFLTRDESLVPPAEALDAAGQADLVVILDTCAANQLEAVAPLLPACRDKLAVIDHHRTREPIAPLIWADESAAAVGVMAAELLGDVGWAMSPEIARAVMTAVCTDTGWLRFSNTDSRALAVVGRCLDAGADPDALYRTLFQSDRPQRLALLARMLAGMETHADGCVALSILAQADFAETGATYDETENLINEPMRVGRVCVSALLVEQPSGEEEGPPIIRGSLRSKPTIAPGMPGKVLDVAELARSLGGGGHARAAGFRMEGTLQEVRTVLLLHLNQALRPNQR